MARSAAKICIWSGWICWQIQLGGDTSIPSESAGFRARASLVQDIYTRKQTCCHYSVQYTVYTVHCTVYGVQCTVTLNIIHYVCTVPPWLSSLSPWIPFSYNQNQYIFSRLLLCILNLWITYKLLIRSLVCAVHCGKSKFQTAPKDSDTLSKHILKWVLNSFDWLKGEIYAPKLLFWYKQQWEHSILGKCLKGCHRLKQQPENKNLRGIAEFYPW